MGNCLPRYTNELSTSARGSKRMSKLGQLVIVGVCVIGVGLAG